MDTPPKLPSPLITLLIVLAPALVMATLRLLPQSLNQNPIGILLMLGTAGFGPAIAGFNAGGRIAAHRSTLPRAGLRVLCIIASYMLTFFGCVVLLQR